MCENDYSWMINIFNILFTFSVKYLTVFSKWSIESFNSLNWPHVGQACAKDNKNEELPAPRSDGHCVRKPLTDEMILISPI
ncbi:hypothetical protein DERF_013368 [Dermatophagoides farinae]|uniref:Uncharacterized protein n=1 Tax=Dermatophagoides farinae TaxID=6954 RepID=A0A922HPJ5_DERFA|nr:hypothetical protein DERF_013368 [Dermatophagoides farinae]